MKPISRQSVTVVFKGENLTVSLLISKRTNNKWIVCLHGLQSNAQLFEDLFTQSFLNSYSLLAIDLIGFGNSAKSDDFSYDIADQAEIIKLMLAKLHIKQLHLIGHSLGGMVGVLLLEPLREVILSFANLEGNLVLADCSISKDVVQYTQAEFESTEYERLKESVRQSGQKSTAHRSDWLETITARVFYKTSASIVEWSKHEKLLTLFSEAPTKRMFMYGVENASKAALVPASIKQVGIAGAGHFMLLDNPEACYAALEDFIAE
jgi:pimeloyl-ACP methyl ester carboxylesterase